MSVQKEDATNSITYSYQSDIITFNIPFLVKSKDSIKVYLGNTLLPSSGYTYTDSSVANIYGVITLTNEGKAAYNKARAAIKISREVPITQLENFSSQASYGSASERGLDKLTLIAQDLDLRVDNIEITSSNQPYEKSLRVNIDEQISNNIPNLILQKDRKNKALFFDEYGSVDPKSVSSDSGLSISNGLEIKLEGNTLSKSAFGLKGNYQAGNGVDISGNVISAKTDGSTLSNTVEGLKGNYQAGNGVDISGNTISAKLDGSTLSKSVSGLKGNYQAGDGITIDGNTISANVIDNTDSDSGTDALSARMGSVLSNTLMTLPRVAYSGNYYDLENLPIGGKNVTILPNEDGIPVISAGLSVEAVSENVRQATKDQTGVVQIGDNINVDGYGKISVPVATTTELGLTLHPSAELPARINAKNVISVAKVKRGSPETWGVASIRMIMEAVYPVGSLIIRADNTNPNTLPGLQYTTWERIEGGKYIKTASIDDVGSDDVGKTGGSLFTGTGTSGGSGSTTVSRATESEKGTTSPNTTGGTALSLSQIPKHSHWIGVYQNRAALSVNISSTQVMLPGGTKWTSEEGGSQSHTHFIPELDVNRHTHTIPELDVNSHTHSIPQLSIDPTYINLVIWKRTGDEIPDPADVFDDSIEGTVDEVIEPIIITIYANIPSELWSDTAPYTQTIEAPEIKENDVPIIDVILSDDTEEQSKQLREWSKVTKIRTEDKQLTVVCKDRKPIEDIAIIVKIIRG